MELKEHMTMKHAFELQDFGTRLDVKVCVHAIGNEEGYVTFRDYEIHDFLTGVRLLKQIQETELPEKDVHLIY